MPDTQVEQPKPFNAAEFMKSRNAADAARIAGKEPEKPVPVAAAPAKPAEPKPGEAEAKPGEGEEHTDHLPRWARRQINQAREEAAELRGRLAERDRLSAEQMKPPAVSVSAEDDPEPERKTFATDPEYQRAMGRWDARQEAKKLLGERDKATEQTADQQAWREHVTAMDAKMEADKALLPDWKEVAEKAAGDGENVVKFQPGEHLQFMAMMAGSDVRAYLAYHFAKFPDEFQAMLDLTKTPEAQIKAFHRLEGRVEKLYTAEESTKVIPQAAQASGPPAGHSAAKGSKDRQTPEEGAAERDARKPKPSAEISARGGGAPPADDPAPGTRAWMERRNREQFGR